jgi:FHA domain
VLSLNYQKKEMSMKAVLNGPFGQVDLGSTPLTIGRTPDNQLVLADSEVSSNHAEIYAQEQDYAIIDLGSRNGTFVNNQLSSGLQSKLGSESAFASGYASNGGLGKITDCTVTNVNDGAGTGTINYTTAQGSSLVVDYQLADENGSSKITSLQPRSSPTLTLANFCGALKAGDYQTAYNQLSSAQQSGATEAQFAASLRPNMVTACTVSNVNDTAGTGTISYTFANGATSVIDYVLINENGTWKINSGRQHT